MDRTKCLVIGFVLNGVVLGALTGCGGYENRPRGDAVYVGPPPMYGESTVAVEPEYIYYPGYEVYYRSNTRQYVYRDGRSWVTRNAPPRISAQVLFASPSVRLSFHNSPWLHHAQVARQYPKHWAPPAASHSRDEDHNQRN